MMAAARREASHRARCRRGRGMRAKRGARAVTSRGPGTRRQARSACRIYSRLSRAVRHSHTSSPADAPPPHPPDRSAGAPGGQTPRTTSGRATRRAGARAPSGYRALRARVDLDVGRCCTGVRSIGASSFACCDTSCTRPKSSERPEWVLWLDADARLLPSPERACLTSRVVEARRRRLRRSISWRAGTSLAPHSCGTRSGMVLRASTWSKNVLDGLLALGSAPLMRIATQSGALKYSECDARSGRPASSRRWHRDPPESQRGRDADCRWPEQGRINNFFLGHRAGLRNVSILSASTLDARPSAPLNASRMLVVHQAATSQKLRDTHPRVPPRSGRYSGAVGARARERLRILSPHS